MNKNVEIIDDDLVAPVIPVIPKQAEEITKQVPVAPETVPTQPLEDILPETKEEIKNPMEEIEKQKDSTPAPLAEEETIVTNKAALTDDEEKSPMISGDKVINMLRIILLWSKQHVYVCRMWFESAAEFDAGHSITFFPDEDKMLVERAWESWTFESTKFYPLSQIVEVIIEPYLFSLQQTYAR